mgnify:CR=1 FL=1
MRFSAVSLFQGATGQHPERYPLIGGAFPAWRLRMHLTEQIENRIIPSVADRAWGQTRACIRASALLFPADLTVSSCD